MKAIVYYTNSSNFLPEMVGIALRISYLLCDHVALAGDNIDEILMTEKDYKDVPLKYKISLLEKYQVDEELWQTTLQTFKRDLKDFNQMKNKPAKVIGGFKKMEHYIMVIYNQMVDGIMEHKKKSGITAIMKVLDGKIFGIYNQDRKEAELSEPEKCTISASNLLKLILPDKDQGPDMLVLTYEFLLEEFEGDFIMYTAADERAFVQQNICIESCFTFPNLNMLSDFEMITLRKQLSNTTEDFKKRMNEWLPICYDDPNPASSVLYMQEKLLPAIQIVKKGVDENEMLINCRRVLKNAPGLELHIALVPVELIWKYYKHFEAINETTWQLLQDALQKEDKYQKRWPVFIICHAERMIIGDEKPEPEEEPEFPVTVKKSISVD